VISLIWKRKKGQIIPIALDQKKREKRLGDKAEGGKKKGHASLCRNFWERGGRESVLVRLRQSLKKGEKKREEGVR